MILAIDGPAGAGKSTVARRVARELGFVFLDTGAMYRALTWVALQQGLDPGDEDACARVARTTQLTFDADGKIEIDGRAGEPAIRSREVTLHVSMLSAHPSVRAEVVRDQRALAARHGGVVAEGRDTTTVVFPDAQHKFFLIASSAERARRRALELRQPERVGEIQREIEARDTLDSTRAHSPLTRAPDAVVIETDGLDAEQVALRILAHVRGAPPAAAPATPPAANRPPVDPREPPPAAPPVVTHATLVYRLCRAAMNLWYLPFFRRRVHGVEHLPREGGVVIAANHGSYLDIPLIAIAAPRHVSFVARKSLADSRWLAYVMRQCGAILVEPGGSNRAAVREMIAHLEQRDCVAIFPEGTRTPDGALREFKAGALLAARSAGVPIVPCAIRGTYHAWGKGKALPRPRRIEARFAEPIDSRLPDALERVHATIRTLLERPWR